LFLLSSYLTLSWSVSVYNPYSYNYVYNNGQIYATGTCIINYNIDDYYYNTATAYECVNDYQLRVHTWDTYGEYCLNGDLGDSYEDYYSSTDDLLFLCSGSDEGAFMWYNYTYQYGSLDYSCPESSVTSYQVRSGVQYVCADSTDVYLGWECIDEYDLSYGSFSDSYCSVMTPYKTYDSSCDIVAYCNYYDTYSYIGYNYNNENSTASLSTGGTVGIIIAVIFWVLVCAACCFCCRRRRYTTYNTPMVVMTNPTATTTTTSQSTIVNVNTGGTQPQPQMQYVPQPQMIQQTPTMNYGYAPQQQQQPMYNPNVGYMPQQIPQQQIPQQQMPQQQQPMYNPVYNAPQVGAPVYQVGMGPGNEGEGTNY